MKRWLLAVLVAMSSGVQAEEGQTCNEQQETTAAISECLKQQLQAADGQMADYLTAALAQLDGQDERISALQTAHQQWQNYRRSYCDEVFQKWSGGSIAALFYYDCMLGLTEQHTWRLWNDFLTTMEGEELRPLPLKYR